MSLRVAARLRAGAGRLRRGDPLVRALMVEGFLNRLGFGMVTFALPLYALELGMGITEIGFLIAAKAFVQPAVKPLMGIAVDRFGARRGYLTASGIRFISAVVLLFVATPAGLFAVRFIQGAASAAQEPASISLLAKGDQRRMGRRFSAIIGARDIATVSAGLVAGLVLGATGSFLTLWVLVAALAAASVLVVAVWVRDLPEPADAPAPAPAVATPPVAPAPDADPAGETARRGAGRLLRDPRLRLLAGLGFFGGMTAHMMHALFQVYASVEAGLGPAQIGVIYSISIAALLLVGPLAGWIGDRKGNGILAGARGVANALSSFVYLLFPTFGGLLGGRLLDDSGKAAFRPTWGSLLASASRDAGPRGGRVAGNLDAVLSTGQALGPIVAALIWDLAGVVAFFCVRAVMGIAVELIVGRKLRRWTREQDAVAAAAAPAGAVIRPSDPATR